MTDEPYNPSPIGNPSVLARRNWLQTKLVIFIGKHTPKCRDMVRILSQSMDEPLPWSMRIKKRIHFLICCWCQRYEEQLRYVHKTVCAFPEHADSSSTVPVSGEAKARWKQALRAEPAISGMRPGEIRTAGVIETGSLASKPVQRSNWMWISVFALAAVLIAGFFFAIEKPERPASLADFRDEMVSFAKIEPNLEMRSGKLADLMNWVGRTRAPSQVDIPKAVQNLEPVGCRVLRFRGHDVTLVCFRRENGHLVHLFVMDRAAFPRLPGKEAAKIASQGEWMTAAWAEGGHVYLMAVEGDQALLEQLLANA